MKYQFKFILWGRGKMAAVLQTSFSNAFFNENAFENVVSKTAATLPLPQSPQYVKANYMDSNISVPKLPKCEILYFKEMTKWRMCPQTMTWRYQSMKSLRNLDHLRYQWPWPVAWICKSIFNPIWSIAVLGISYEITVMNATTLHWWLVSSS